MVKKLKTKMKKHILLSMALFASSYAMAEKTYTLPEDTTKVIDIEEVVVIASPKETSKLRQLPTSVSLISQKDMQANHITSLKSASTIVPNFFMPDYGSRLTSAMYIRGIGSRINTPAVGMYVDNIPYLDKSAFDFNFYDIERIDILRGPQGTLYGRNTMGGLVKVHTRSPFSYQGTDVKLSYGSGNNHRSASLTHYHLISDRFAFSAGGYYEGADGFFTNSHLNKKVDDMQAGGGRIRAILLTANDWKFDFNVNYDYTAEGGYPYYFTGDVYSFPPEVTTDLIGKIAYNRESTYRRSLLNTGLNIEHQAENFIFNAVTGFQHLNDRMFMDQDFSPMDTYTLEQKQRINSITEEITFKSKPGRAWQWTTGLFGFYQNMRTTGPVVFYNDGIDFLNTTINGYFPDLSQMGMSMSLGLKNENLDIPSTMDTPSWSTAVFHQSTYHVGNLELSAGLRLEYEKMQMDYNSHASALFDYSLSSRMMPIELKDLKADYQAIGKLKNDYLQLLPKAAIKYNFDSKNNIYFSMSKGHRSGGYNVQMFSDIAQNGLQNSIKTSIKEGVGEKLDGFAQMGMPAAVIGMINGMMDEHLTTTEIDVAESTTYRPEYSWNYEIGTHLHLFNGKLQADFAAFYMDTRDQQIAKFAESGLGRITVNAGESESYGVEANLVASLNRHLQLNASYGYTEATFIKYNAGEDQDYSGNYVPFVPRHTLNIGGSYAFHFPNSWAESLTLGANCTGAGKIYWTEANHVSQDFYTTLNGYISLKAKNVQVDLWGRNLTDKQYTTFYFESMGRGYEQRSKPLQVGVDVRLHF